jgi:hypothetical protein
MIPALAGCIWFGPGYATLDPHRSIERRSPEVSGTVLDEQTHAPVQGARIFFTDHPELKSRSGETGAFRINESHTLYWGSIYGPGGATDWPRKYENWSPDLTVSHRNYTPRKLNWYDRARTNDVVLLRRLGGTPDAR